MFKRHALLLLLALAIGLFVPRPAMSQNYPTKPVRLIVPVAPGGPIDTIARLAGEALEKELGQPVIVESRAGAGGTIASKAVATADPDGYTLLFATLQTFGIAPALYTNTGYATKDFTPVVMVAEFPFLFVAPAVVPAKTVKEFIEFARTSKEKLSFGGSLATPAQLLGELFARTNKLDIVYVPYKGLAPSISDLIGGRTHMAFDAMGNLLPLVKEGKLRPLAILSAERSKFLPDVPTMAESGLTDFPVNPWAGIVAPAGTPDAVIQRLNTAVNNALTQPNMRERMESLALTPAGGTPQRFADKIKSDEPVWRDLVQQSGAKPQ